MINYAFCKFMMTNDVIEDFMYILKTKDLSIEVVAMCFLLVLHVYTHKCKADKVKKE